MSMYNKKLSNNIVSFVTNLSERQRDIAWTVIDLLGFFAASLITSILFVNVLDITPQFFLLDVLTSYLLYLFLGWQFHLRNIINRYNTLAILTRYFLLASGASLIASAIVGLITNFFSLRYILLTAFLVGVYTLFVRLVWRQIYLVNGVVESDSKVAVRTIVIGAGDGGSTFLNTLERTHNHLEVVAIVDDDESKQGKMIYGVPVLGAIHDLEEIAARYQAEQAVVAIPSLSPEKYEKILTHCNNAGLKVFKMPYIENVITGKYHVQSGTVDIEISDLLGRDEVVLDDETLINEIEGKVILVTGAGGSIGSEIVRRLTPLNPTRIVLLGHGENSIYNIYHEMINKPTTVEYKPVIADVQDFELLLRIFKEEKPEIVYHAAAHKHVPLMEGSPSSAFRNNVQGTYNVARAVDQAGVGKMVMVSTDKAVRPTNVMGSTKRMAEMIVTAMDKVSDSNYCVVRFGNVLGSRGSVIPLFKRQIAAGGPVTVTDFRMTRYFMTIPEASRLVIYAGAFAKGGEIFILNMNEPIKIVDLAKKMILLSGHSINEIPIVEIGRRPGEKLYEELLTSGEEVDSQVTDDIYVAKVKDTTLTELEAKMEELRTLDDKEIKEEIIAYANESAE